MKKSTLFNKIAIDIIGVLFLIFAFMNNPYRFSNKVILLKLTHSIVSFSLIFMLIIMMVLIMYSKILTILNLDDIFSMSIPFFVILVFSLTILIIIYIHTDIGTAGICINSDTKSTKNIDCEQIEDINNCEKSKVCKWTTNFNSPPIYMLDSKYRIIIHLVSLLITLFNLYIFVNYFNKNNNINFSILNKILTSDTKQNKAQPLIIGFFVINIILHFIIIFQQLLFHPCKIDLPNSWDF